MAKAYFGNGAPFSRALDYNQRLGIMIRGGKQLQEVIGELGVYESRGHGRAKNSGLTVAKAHRATYLKLRGKQYEAIQGKQEIARRLCTAPEVKPRRLWTAVSMATCDGEALTFTASTRSRVIHGARAYGFIVNTPVLGVLHG